MTDRMNHKNRYEAYCCALAEARHDTTLADRLKQLKGSEFICQVPVEPAPEKEAGDGSGE